MRMVVCWSWGCRCERGRSFGSFIRFPVRGRLQRLWGSVARRTVMGFSWRSSLTPRRLSSGPSNSRPRIGQPRTPEAFERSEMRMIDRRSEWGRQELYEKVWQVPLRELAAEYNMSDVGLAKVCRKLGIPLPGLGHWTKIACGHAIARPPLPAMENVPVLIREIREPKTPVLPEDEVKLEVI